MKKEPKKIYLATAYKTLTKLSFKVSNQIAGELIKKGNIVFSPISHSHPIWLEGHQDINHDAWLAQDKEFVKWCTDLYIIRINGKWGQEKLNNSKGVQQEITWAKEMKKKIKYIDVKI